MSAGGKRWKPYPTYKNSGVEWLGMVPEGWEIVKIKHLTSKVGSGKTPSGGATAYQDSGILFLRSQNVYDEKLELGDVVYISDEIDLEMRTSRVLPGDVLLNITGASLGRTYRVPLDFPLANVNQHVCILRFGDTAGFAAWMMKSTLMKAQIAFCQSGAAREGLNFEEIRALFFPLPPLPEQQAIAAFLDQQCAQIDSLIEKKERMLDLLEEKRRAVITQAVTRGLDPTVPMKDSGVEWLGMVPKEWEVKALKFFFPQLRSGVSVNAEPRPATEDSFGVLKTSCVYGNEFIPTENKRVFDNEIERLTCHVTKNSLIISRMNTPELVGNCGYVECDYPNLFLPDRLWLANFELQRQTSPRFVWYLLISKLLVSITAILATGTSGSMKNLAQDKFLGIYVALPPLPEQQAIADYLDAQCAAMDSQRKSLEKSIELLREYRASLITHAVTGKIDVRDVAPLQ